MPQTEFTRVAVDFSAIDPAARTAEQRTAAAIDAQLEQMATTCNSGAVTSQDGRWNRAALALLGARRLFRDLMHDDDRRQA